MFTTIKNMLGITDNKTTTGPLNLSNLDDAIEYAIAVSRRTDQVVGVVRDSKVHAQDMAQNETFTDIESALRACGQQYAYRVYPVGDYTKPIVLAAAQKGRRVK